MIEIEKMKDDVFNIIVSPDRIYSNNEQYFFACGIALSVLLFTKEYSDYLSTSFYEDLINTSNFTEFTKEINNLIEKNVDYIETLPLYKKNLFNYIMDYEPNEDNFYPDYKEYFIYGTKNSILYFEFEPIKISEYAKLHDINPNTIYYHIKKGNIKSTKKIGGKFFIQNNEPYPSRKRK